jgi:hypothetical protein
MKDLKGSVKKKFDKTSCFSSKYTWFDLTVECGKAWMRACDKAIVDTQLVHFLLNLVAGA